MSVTIDGNSLVFDGTVTVSNFNASPTTGVCTLILTPNGGVGSFPALAQGLPGQSPLLTLGTVSTLAPGSAATVTLNETSAGGAGVASAYTINFGIPQGAAGSNGTTVLGDAVDLKGNGTPVAGDMVTVQTVSGGVPLFQYTPFPWGNVYNANTFTTANESGPTQATLATVSIPAQPAAYYPLAFANIIANGTGNTAIQLEALLDSATTGQVVAQSFAATGATQRISIGPGFAALIGASGYGAVAANTAAELYLVVSQTANVTDAWSVESNQISFTVATFPVAAT